MVRARSEAEAAWLVAESREGTRVIAGGTDLMLGIERKKFAPVGLIDIRRAGMNRIDITDNAVRIGATTTATELSKFAPLQSVAAGLWEAAATLSVPTIRNMATLGGNIANASPAADMVPPVMAMGGVVTVRRGDEKRKVSLEKLATGPGRTQLTGDDLITSIELPKWADDAFHHFVKLGFRDAQIIAVCSLAMSCDMDGDVVRKVGIALGSVGPTVTRAHAVEEFLIGKRLSREVGHEAMALLAQDISPITDIRSEAAFRLKVAQNYLGDALGRAYIHSLGQDARGVADDKHLEVLKDPAPRPPSLARARTDVLGAVHSKQKTLRILSTSEDAYLTRDAGSGQPKRNSMATRKKKTTKKKATKRKTKKKAAKRKTKKKTAKKKTKKKAAKKKTKKKAAKKKATKRKTKKKAAKKKTARKAGKKKAAKKKAKKKAAKKKAKKKATKRKATKRKTTKRKTKRKTAKKKTTKRKAKKKATRRRK